MVTQTDIVQEETAFEFFKAMIDGITDAWIEFFTRLCEFLPIPLIVFVWFLLAVTSPIWVGPYLLYRRHKQQCGKAAAEQDQ